MAKEGLRRELAIALPKALHSGAKVICRYLSIGTNGGTQRVDLTVNPVQEPEALRGMAMVVFADVDAPQAAELHDPHDAAGGKTASCSSRRAAELEQALNEAQQEIQACREEMQTSQEELKSSNEELQTVNAELQSKVDELSTTNNDMKNLLNSTDMATAFLDSALHVRRFTTQATRIFRLIPGDLGQPLSDIVTDLDYSGLPDDAEKVLNTLVFSEREIATGDGRWFQVKIMPYRTLENVIDGVVLTINDIGRAKCLEAELRAKSGEAKEPT